MIPQQIILQPENLVLNWGDKTFSLSADVLRRNCRCTNCRAATLKGIEISLPAELKLTGSEAIGHYGLQLRFSDGHDRGIYPWNYLHELTEAQPLI